MTDKLGVYAAIVSVMKEIGEHGIAKSRNNVKQGYKFRGIDDVYNELNGILSKNSLIMLPKVTSREQVERQSSSGGSLFFTNLAVEFTLVCALDGSSAVISTVGEAMDSGDKSSNKALSAAYKYAAMMVFCIPTEGDNDADTTTHEVAPKAQSREPYEKISKGIREIVDHSTMEDLNSWYKKHIGTMESFPPDWAEAIKAEFTDAKATLKAKVTI
jgi:hypothetical protein